MIADFKMNGIGLEFTIETIVPITNLPLLLGLRKEEENEAEVCNTKIELSAFTKIRMSGFEMSIMRIRRHYGPRQGHFYDEPQRDQALPSYT
jgi:hypothetical protein